MLTKTPVRRQIFSTVCGNLLSASSGAYTGWAAVNFVSLQKDDTTFPSGPLTLTQATRVMSVFFASSVIGNLLFPHIVRRFGSKKTLFALGFPQLISWTLIIFAQNPYYLYASRTLSGFTFAGLYNALPEFVMDISNDEIRGTLMSFYDPFVNIGMLIAFLLGKYFTYADQAMYQMIWAVLFVILFARIPQTPGHLVNMEKQKAANKAHTYFKGIGINSPLVAADDKNCADDENTELTLSDLTNHRARKAMFIAFSLVLLNALQGFLILLAFMSDVFEKSNPNISSIDSSIVITGMLIMANLFYVNLIDRANRRTFYIYSSLATTVGHIVFALYLYFLADNHTFDWVPIVIMSFALFSTSLGMDPVPWLMMMELLPKKIKSYAYSICLVLALVLQFVLTELYPPILERFGLIAWISFFATACLCNALFGIFVVPETKGKSHEEIMKLLD